jgi:N-acetylglucosaminyldiphosphoundecaprenol N-acetyl-beta-D-mannosaminyltransferase
MEHVDSLTFVRSSEPETGRRRANAHNTSLRKRVEMAARAVPTILRGASAFGSSSENGLERAAVCGLPVLTHSLSEVENLIYSWTARRRGGWIITLNLEMVSQCVLDPSYSALVRSADCIIADGMPIVIASHVAARRYGTSPIRSRCNGTDLVKRLLTSKRFDRVAVIGGRDPRRAVEMLRPDGGSDEDVFIYRGEVDFKDPGHETLVSRLIDQLRARNVQLVLLALGVPKQDLLAARVRAALPGAVIIGVGGALDILAGLRCRAPVFMQSHCLEWLYRLATDPRRLWRRYVLKYPFGLAFLLRDLAARSP